MTRVYNEGFEMQDFIGSFQTTYGGFTQAIDTTIYRISGASWKEASASGNSSTAFVLPGGCAVAEFYIRFALYIGLSDLGYSKGYIQLRNNAAAELYSVRWSPGQPLQVYVAGVSKIISTMILLPYQWYLIELHCLTNAVTGTVELKIEGSSQGSWSGNTGSTNLYDYIFQAYNICSYEIDDMAINDTGGGAPDNTWVADGHFIALVPNADGSSSQWTGSDGNSVNNYLLIDDTPSNNDTDYVVDSTSTHKDEYNLPSMTAWLTGQTCRHVQAEARARIEAADGSTVAVGIKSGATEDFASFTALTTSYARALGTLHVTNPDTAGAWTEANIAALEVGIKVP
jgi:hypothetical protein